MSWLSWGRTKREKYKSEATPSPFDHVECSGDCGPIGDPYGKLFGFVEEEVGAAAVFGWLIFFVPLLASALALCGIYFSRSALTRPTVIIAMPGSFLIAFLPLFMYWKDSSNFIEIGIGATILFGLNVLALWEPFKDRLESPSSESLDIDREK